MWLENLAQIAAAAKKAEEDYASSSFVLEQEHTALDALYRKTEELSRTLREQDASLEEIRGQVAALEAADRQFDGRLALLQGSIRNNEENTARIREELSQQDGRSSGIARQIAGSRQRIAAIDEDLNARLARFRSSTSSCILFFFASIFRVPLLFISQFHWKNP